MSRRHFAIDSNDRCVPWWIILVWGFSISNVRAYYLHGRTAEAKHVDHVWIAENSIDLQEVITTQTNAQSPALKTTAVLISLTHFSAHSNLFLWIRKDRKRLRLNQSQTRGYWTGVPPLFSFAGFRAIISATANWISDWGYEFSGFISLQQSITCFQ